MITALALLWKRLPAGILSTLVLFGWFLTPFLLVGLFSATCSVSLMQAVLLPKTIGKTTITAPGGKQERLEKKKKKKKGAIRPAWP